MRAFVLLLGALATGACTTLGPMPATTGVSAVPAGRPDLEATIAAAPAYYLSSGATRDPHGTAVGQLLAVFDPDRLVLPGLVFAARGVASGGAGGFVEPILGYRGALSDRFAGAVLLYATHASGEQNGASFAVDRFGAELQGDVRVTGESRWLELHLGWGIAVTGLSGHGSYCVDGDGYGVDCGDSAATADVAASGAYLSASGAVALELFRRRESWFHGGRLAFSVAGGTMPTVRGSAQADAAAYVSAGLSLSIAVGSAR